MHHFVESVRRSIKEKNWYSALSMALTLPDICGRLEAPNKKSQARYEGWFDRYILGKYQTQAGRFVDAHTFLCASDCYSLRCAFLHQGDFSIEDQRAQTVLNNFHFIAPFGNGIEIHKNQSGSTLQLQVDIFCEDICSGVERWLGDVNNDAEIVDRIDKLGKIHAPVLGARFVW
jgi:hypothetical protein